MGDPIEYEIPTACSLTFGDKVGRFKSFKIAYSAKKDYLEVTLLLPENDYDWAIEKPLLEFQDKDTDQNYRTLSVSLAPLRCQATAQRIHDHLHLTTADQQAKDILKKYLQSHESRLNKSVL